MADFCTNCGAKIEPDATFCGQCGAQIKGTGSKPKAQSQPTQNTPQKPTTVAGNSGAAQKHRGLPWGTLIIIGVLIIAGAAFFVFRHARNSIKNHLPSRNSNAVVANATKPQIVPPAPVPPIQPPAIVFPTPPVPPARVPRGQQRKAPEGYVRKQPEPFPAIPPGAPVVVQATIHNNEKSITVLLGHLYIYGMATGGAASSSPFASGQFMQATDAAGHVAAELAFGEKELSASGTEMV